MIEFALSDGENSAECVIHNCGSKYLAGGLDNKTLADYDRLLRISIAEGKPIKIEGAYTNLNRKRLFIVEEALPYPEGVACKEVLVAGEKGGSGLRLS